ncbi:Uncharacterised protein [Sphingobacterium multivorum]|jgi:hypothetical protein|nr:Uncharacterised protein [Sphingobacterium multivorum]
MINILLKTVTDAIDINQADRDLISKLFREKKY